MTKQTYADYLDAAQKWLAERPDLRYVVVGGVLKSVTVTGAGSGYPAPPAPFITGDWSVTYPPISEQPKHAGVFPRQAMREGWGG